MNDESFISVGQKFYSDIEMEVIARVKPKSAPDIEDGDIIKVVIDTDKYTIEDARDMFETCKRFFPNNTVILMYDGIDLQVERNKE